MKSQTILLTGGAGYIGAHIALELLDANRRVVVLDDLSTGDRKSIPPQAIFAEGDIRDSALLDSISRSENAGAIIHAAAVASVPESIADPARCRDININGANAVIQAARRSGIPYVVFSSTSAVYDENAPAPFAEDSPTSPISPYAESKLAAEKTLAKIAETDSNFRFASLRYFNVAGADPSLRTGDRKRAATTLIKSALECAAGKRPYVDIFGADYPTPDGTCVRDYIHVSDIARAHLLALAHLENGGDSEVFNLGIGRGFSVREIIAAAKSITGIDFMTRESPRRPGDPAAIVADISKANRVLGFRPHYADLEKIIADAWAWEKKNSRQD